jgi:outer membrane protein assembly factor BamB
MAQYSLPATIPAGQSLSSAVACTSRTWQGLVFVGNAGGDFKDAKGHMYALDAKTGKIVWQFFLVPKTGHQVRWFTARHRGYSF